MGTNTSTGVLVNFLLAVIFIGICGGLAHCQSVPSTPAPQHMVEHDPGAWGATTVFTSTLTGTFTKPWIGFAAGSAVAVFGNMQNSRNAHQDMVGGLIGAGVGYVVIKTLKQDWHHNRSK